MIVIPLNRLWDDLRRPGVLMMLVVVVALAIGAWSAWSLEDLRFLFLRLSHFPQR
jgi:hypothetical protein